MMHHQRMIDVEILTLSQGSSVTFKLPPSATARDVREEIEQKLGIPALEQRLAVGTKVFDGAQRLEDMVDDQGSKAQVTLVRMEGIQSAALSGTRGGALMLWDLKDGKLVQKIRESGTAVICVAMNWVMQLALCGDTQGMLELWDLDRAKLLRTMRSPAGQEHAVLCLSSDWILMRAISGYQDSTLRMWDLEVGETLFQLNGHSGPVHCVAWNVYLNVALSGSQDRSLRLWDLSSGKTMHELVGHLAPIHCVAADFARQIAVSGSIATVRVWWNISSTYHYYRDLSGHTGQVLSVVADFTRRVIVTGSADGSVRLWSLAGRRLLNVPQGLVAVTCVAPLWASNEFLVGSDNGSLHIWNELGGLRTRLNHDAENAGIDPVSCVTCAGVEAVETRPSLCSPVAALLSLPGESPKASRKVYPVLVQPGNVSGTKSVRPTMADLQEHLAAHKIMYFERLRFQQTGCSARMSSTDKLPLPPNPILIHGPDSVLQMLSLALSKEVERITASGKGITIASFEFTNTDDEETVDWLEGFWK